MGISESEYRAMLANNDQLSVKDDGTPRQGKAKTPLVACSHFSGPVIVPTEHEEQVALFQWAAANEEEHEELKLLFAVPNGGYRPMATAAQLKAEGVRAGVPDVCLPVARGRFHSLWIEMKRKPNTTSDAQRAWLDALRRYGHCAVVCWSANEAINSIISYLEQE